MTLAPVANHFMLVNYDSIVVPDWKKTILRPKSRNLRA